jgi:putative ABC transport system ATP-binding protein
LLEQLSLTHVAGNLPRELSVGEEMRVAVARALIHRPAIVLADEPTANLDGALGSEVARCLADAALSRGAAVLVATHDPRLESLASRTLQLVDGALVGEGAPL